MVEERRKQIHIILSGEQVDDYDLVRRFTGITNDNDLVRHLLRQKVLEIRGTEQRLELKERA
jgi:hypothetical protein